MIEMCKQHWINWLESVEQQEIYTANKYLVSEPTDYSSARIPRLHTNINGIKGMAEDNEAKARELAKSFFPPPWLLLVSCQTRHTLCPSKASDFL